MKERIVKAFQDLASVKGFCSVTMDELAAHARVSKRTIYRYFRSKDEIVEAVLDSFMSDLADGIGKLIAEEDNLAVFMSKIVKHFSHHANSFLKPPVLRDLRLHYPHLWKKVDQFRKEKIQNFIQLIMAKKGNGGLRKINHQVFTAAFIASIQAVINPEFILDHGLTLDETAKQVVELFVYGLIENGEGN